MNDIEDLAKKVKALPVDQKLYLAAGLLSSKRPNDRESALIIVESARFDLLADKYLPGLAKKEVP
jgi:hypothetical protein